MHPLRRFIRLLESSAPTDTTILDRILDIVGTWVGHGPVPDEDMNFVWQHWPRPEQPMRLWRVHVLDERQAKALTKGLTLPVHGFLSWTTSKDAVEALAQGRTRGGGTPVVIEMMIPPDDICIVVNALTQYLHEVEDELGADFDTGALRDYAHEDEVIVRHASPLVLTPANTTVFEIEKDTPMPVIGDLVFRPGGEDGYPVEEVLGREGAAWVVLCGLGDVHVRRIAPGEWEEIDFYG